MNKYFVFAIITTLAIGSILAVGANGLSNSIVLAQDNMSMSMDNSSMPMDHMGNMNMGMDNSTSTGSNSTAP
jgi:hypothetical protein